ncbi:hypothetical protein L228DRAFT_127872 [Xylona heveae TC161]|uniref:Aminoglycoside phosphotransferase domain-containing protein n=1 Tax=Xylona heveae (strain CBS 132557 / TC161) TaxID=1328760 RepID=A0A165GRW5_XYLHT|nr:hypothetical protein L228DRAFT_127872 [Xylona heveae TC161]KZF22517.1 hypothetical protein L228DRAFT_127872 [Xylona heveae TC161]
MHRLWTPSLLRPDFTWPCPMQSTIRKSTPPVPSIPGRTRRRLWGLFHKLLYRFSEWYCSWFDVYFDPHIVQLPFGLVMKWTDRTSIEECAAMQMARAAGMPVPKVLACGEHPNDPYNRFVSILMTRLPGISLENSYSSLDVDSEEPWLFELKQCVEAMRLWCPPDPSRISSVIGTALRSSRVPNHIMGPFANEEEFHDFLLSPASRNGFKSTEEYEKTLEHANEIRKLPHRITFTHGDLKAHNILAGDDGHLSGFLDWESGGWYPEYWDFTTAMRFGRNSWWYQLASWMGGDQYNKELACDIALNRLTVDSYIAF